MKKITKKILSVVLALSVLLCSSLALSLSAYAADDVVFTDSLGIEYRGQILYGVPGEEIDLTPVLPADPDYFMGVSSLDYSVVEDIWNEDGSEILSVDAIDNGVALINVWYVEGEDIVDDFYVLVVVSDGAELGSVTSMDVDDVCLGYEEEVYIYPNVESDNEGVFYCAFFDSYDYEAPFMIFNDGSCFGYDGGSGEAVCYIIDAQGDVFTDTFEIEVENPSLLYIILQYISIIIEFILEFIK